MLHALDGTEATTCLHAKGLHSYDTM